MYNIFPLILCLIPIHSIYAQNVGEIELKTYFNSIIKLSCFIIGSVFILNLILSNLNTSGILFSIIFYALINAGYVFMNLFSRYKRSLKRIRYIFSIIYLLLLLMLSICTYYIFSIFPNLTVLISKIAFFTSLFITFFILLDICNKITSLKNISNIAEQEISQLSKNLNITNIDIKNCPDIYHIILDSHSGFNNPKYSDEFFRTELEKRGFHIYKNVRSNYNYTGMSFSSFLNFNYIEEFFPEEEKPIKTQKMWVYYEKCKLFSLLKKIGYKFICVYSESLFKIIKHSYIDNNDFINSFDKMHNPILNLIYNFSLFNILTPHKLSLDNNKPLEILNIFNNVCSKTYNQPTFYYMHLLAPHYPYIKNEKGKDIIKIERRNIKHYMSYQKYINKKFLKNIDTILKNMKKNSIIILHSDHSLNFDNKHNNFYNILFAVYSSEEELKTCIPDNSTLVNMYRFILNKIFNLNFAILPNKYYSVENFLQEKEYLKEIVNIEDE